MQLVTLGGAALRLAPPGNERLETTRVLQVGVSGHESNAAVAASRLGAESTWLTRLPEGPLGRRVAADVRGNDVTVVADYTDARQGVSFFERGPPPRGNARVDDLQGTAIEGLTMDAVPDDVVESADTAYVTAATPRASTGLAGAAAKFLKTASDAGATTAVGLFTTRGWDDYDAARDTLEGLFPAVDVFIATASAVEAVFNRGGDVGSAMHALASNHDFTTVALTHESGAATWHDSTVHEFALSDVDVVDISGAADAFAGVFLTILADENVQSALQTAVAAEALAMATPDPLPVFTAAEVNRVRERVTRP